MNYFFNRLECLKLDEGLYRMSDELIPNLFGLAPGLYCWKHKLETGWAVLGTQLHESSLTISQESEIPVLLYWPETKMSEVFEGSVFLSGFILPFFSF